MKRRDLLAYLNTRGVRLLREGRSHSVFVNPRNTRQSSIPRHKEIATFTMRAICRQLDIPPPQGR